MSKSVRHRKFPFRWPEPKAATVGNVRQPASSAAPRMTITLCDALPEGLMGFPRLPDLSVEEQIRRHAVIFK